MAGTVTDRRPGEADEVAPVGADDLCGRGAGGGAGDTGARRPAALIPAPGKA